MCYDTMSLYDSLEEAKIPSLASSEVLIRLFLEAPGVGVHVDQGCSSNLDTALVSHETYKEYNRTLDSVAFPKPDLYW